MVNKPLTTLQQQFLAPKSRPSLESQTNIVYKIPCADCSWCYVGETGKAFNTRKKEHRRNVKTLAKGSRIANHVWSNNHAIDFKHTSVIDQGGFRTRKTLEVWHSKLTPNRITIPVLCLDSTKFFSTNIPSYYHLNFATSHVVFFYLFNILPVEGCSSNSQKLVFLKFF